MHCVSYKHVQVGPQLIMSSCNVVNMHRSARRRCRKTSVAWSVPNQSGEKIQNPVSGVLLSSIVSIQPVERSLALPDKSNALSSLLLKHILMHIWRVLLRHWEEARLQPRLSLALPGLSAFHYIADDRVKAWVASKKLSILGEK